MAFSTQLKRLPQLDDLEVLKAETNRHRFPVHCHSTLVIQLIEQGADWCSATNQVARQGEVFVHMPHTAHSGGTLSGRPLHYAAIYPTTKLVSDLLGILQVQIPSNLSFVSRNQDLLALMRTLFVNLNHLHRVDTIKPLMTQVFQLVLKESQFVLSPAEQAPPHAKIQIARNYLSQHCQRDVSIAELSERAQLSRFHLIRQFKKQLGITPRQFLISQRVAKAKVCLAGGMPICETAYECGFADQSHLNRCFKRVAGYAPGKFVDESSNHSR